MRKITLTSLLLVLAPVASGQDSLAERFPADAMVYLSADTHRLVEGTVGLDLAKLLDEPQVQQFLAPLADQLPAPISTQGLRQLIDMVPWRQYVDGRAELAIRGVHVDVDGQSFDLSPSQPLNARDLNRMLGLAAKFGAEHEGAKSRPEHPVTLSATLDFVLALDAGDRFGEFFDSALQKLGEHMGGTPQSAPCRVGGHDATKYTLPFGGSFEEDVYVVRDGKRWWWAGSPATLEHCLGGARQDSLARSASFSNFLTQVSGGKPAVLAYFDVAKLGRVFERTVAPIVKDELDLLGLSGVEALGFASSFVEGGVRDSLALTFSEKPHGFLGLLDSGKGGFQLMRRAPSSTGFYFGARFDAAALVEKFTAVCRDLFPGSEVAIERGFEEANAELGMDVRRDVLAAFGDELGFFLTAPSQGALIPDGMLTLKVADRDRFEKLLVRGLEMAQKQGQLQWKETTAFGDGCRGWALTIAGAPVQPAIALTKDLFCVSSSVFALKKALRDAPSEAPASSLLDGDDLKRVLTGLTGAPTADGLSLLAFLDLGTAIDVGYEFLPMAGDDVRKATGGKLDLSTLPETETVRRHFSGIGVGARSSEHGVTLSFFTPVGIAPAMALAASRLHQLLGARGHVQPPTKQGHDYLPRGAKPSEPAATPKKPSGATRLADVFSNLEKATGASIEFPEDLGDLEVAYESRSGDLETNLAALARIGKFDFTIREVDGEKHVVVSKR